jgi:hypothetical protein
LNNALLDPAEQSITNIGKEHKKGKNLFSILQAVLWDCLKDGNDNLIELYK